MSSTEPSSEVPIACIWKRTASWRSRRRWISAITSPPLAPSRPTVITVISAVAIGSALHAPGLVAMRSKYLAPASRRGTLTAVERDADRGYFPRGESVLRRVHGAKVVGFIYGQRALLLQATQPLAFTGLIANTDGLRAPFARLARTAKTMERIWFGTRAEADAITDRVRRVHSRVSGEISYDAGQIGRASCREGGWVVERGWH